MIIPSCNDRHAVELSEKPPLYTDVGNSVGVLGLGGDLGGEGRGVAEPCLGQWGTVIRADQCGPQYIRRAVWHQRNHITQRSPPYRSPTPHQSWTYSPHPRSCTTAPVPRPLKIWTSAPEGNWPGLRRTSTSGPPVLRTSRVTVCSGPAKLVSANPVRWTAGEPPLWGNAAGWRRWTTRLRRYDDAPRQTPASVYPRWRSWGTPSSTSRAFRTCLGNRWKTTTACLWRAALSLLAPPRAVLKAW